ncbi:hypothetical protein MMC10_008594 [Thelotrema lepadinum]|nr:hypothetical protein [Thelotrema lepadinum]
MRIRGANALSGIVRAMRERQMSDPKDKSFGLHGILARIFQDNPSKPNYGDSLGRVYRTLFSDFLTWSPSAINFLLDAGPGLEGSPTWVPDWSSVNNRTWVLPEYVFNFLDRIERSGRQQPHVKLKNDTLSVKCSIQGAIEYCSGTIKEAPTDPQHITEHIQTFTQLGIWLLSTRKFFIPRGNHCRSIRQGLWDILPLDPVKQEESSSLPEEPEEIHEFLFSSRRVGTLQKPHIDKTARFLAWYDLVLTDESPLIQREDSDFSYSNEEWVDAVTSFIAANPAIYEFNNATAKILGEQRSLFFAGTNCIGSSTLDVQPGDEIAIIESVRLPMVLRAASSSSLPTYTVVGPAIISGYDGPEYAQDERFTWINLV